MFQENRTTSCNTDDCPATIAGAGGNIPLLISIASIVGALAISAAAYMTVTACLGLAAAGDEKKRVTATSAFAIYAIQAGTMGMIQVMIHGQPHLVFLTAKCFFTSFIVFVRHQHRLFTDVFMTTLLRDLTVARQDQTKDEKST